MKQYKPSSNVKTEDDENSKETLVFDRNYNGYFLRTSAKLIDMRVLSKEESFYYLAKQYKKIFPQYDEKLHYIDYMLYEVPTLLVNDCTVVGLYEYVDSPNKFWGSYVFEDTNRGTLIKKVDFSRDNFIDLRGNFDLIKDFNEFKNNKEKYRRLGPRARKGLLFYGPPGNGKTAQITNLAARAEEDKFRVFFIDRKFPLKDLLQFKSLFEDDDNVFIIEEITERADGRAAEEVLSFLDGELSWKNSYVIATTNNPEELPWNLVDRPSRFKIILEFPNPTDKEREVYLRHMKVNDSLIEETVKLTENMSLDYIKNIVLDSFLEDKTIPELIKEYKERRNKVGNKFKSQKLGLGS